MDESLLEKIIPQTWTYSLEQPTIKGLAAQPGYKKPQLARYTVYISNGGLFGTRHFVSTWVDGNSLSQCFQQALANVDDVIAQRIAEDTKAGKKDTKWFVQYNARPIAVL